jgi:hypothetical protein
MTSPEIVAGEVFTDRGRGKGFVLSAFRAASGAAEGKQIITHSIHATCNGCMKCHLLSMCQNITHVYKQIVN